MEIQFRADYAYLQSQQTNTRAKSTSSQNQTPVNPALTPISKDNYQVEIYSISGSIRTANNGNGSSLTKFHKLMAVAKGQAEFLRAISGKRTSKSFHNTLNFDVLSKQMPHDIEGLVEYWNKENTAERIFTIALLGFEDGGDRQEAAEKAIKMINHAYGNVQGMMGGSLPQLVSDTKAAVLHAMEQFRGDKPIHEITFE